MKPYCTQNNGICETCSLVNYGRDCQNNLIKDDYTIGTLAEAVTGGNERSMRKLLNDAGADPRLDEYTTSPGEMVTRVLVVDLLAQRAGDRVGRKLAELL